MPPSSSLTVRHFAREAFRLDVEFVVDELHRSQIALSAMSPASSRTSIRGTATDISGGGIGWISDVYLPRMCEGVIRVFAPTRNAAEAATSNQLQQRQVFEQHVKVRRVMMAGPEPSYAIGMSFLSAPTDIEQRVERIKSLGQACADVVPKGGEDDRA